MDKYVLLDSGDLKKLEQFGPITLIRPCPYALWSPEQKEMVWGNADAIFTRDNRWQRRRLELSSWNVSHGGFKFHLSLGDSGNVGLFPEHESHYAWITEQILTGFALKKEQIFILNLFAYTGGTTLVAAKAGACVCHVDASKTAVAWARDNAHLNALIHAPIRWIVDDAMEFAKRELRRGKKYDGIILDPPTFGRGPAGELFKIEEHMPSLIDICQGLLTTNPLFFLLTSHTPGYSHLVLHHLLAQKFHGWKGTLETGDMTLSSQGKYALPSGSFARWNNEI